MSTPINEKTKNEHSVFISTCLLHCNIIKIHCNRFTPHPQRPINNVVISPCKGPITATA